MSRGADGGVGGHSISEQLRVVSLSGAKQRSASCIGTKCTWYHNSMGESAHKRRKPATAASG